MHAEPTPSRATVRSATATAERVAIQHAIAAAADTHAHARWLDDHERLAHLTEAVGDVAADLLRNGSLDLDACLLRAAGELQGWLEHRTADHRENGAVERACGARYNATTTCHLPAGHGGYWHDCGRSCWTVDDPAECHLCGAPKAADDVFCTEPCERSAA